MLPELPQPLPDDRDQLRRGDKSILVVEDDLNFAKTLMIIVREKGFGCIVVADGASGIHLADLYQPSAIILDVMLPGLDGWGVMRYITQQPRLKNMEVLIISGDMLDQGQTEEIQTHDYAFINKGEFKVNRVLETVADLLEVNGTR